MICNCLRRLDGCPGAGCSCFCHTPDSTAVVTAPVREWREIRPEEAKAGDLLRLHRDGNGTPFVVEGIAHHDQHRFLVVGATGASQHQFVVDFSSGTPKVERAVTPLPTEPGTVIDATVDDGYGRPRRARLILTTDTDSAPWIASNLRERRYIGLDEISDWSLVASAPTDGGEQK